MSNREKLPELIDRYNNGELEGEELTAFLEMMKVSSRLRKEVKLDSELNEILSNKDSLELHQIILSVQKKRRKKKGPDLHAFLLAASLLLLIGMGIFLIITNSRHHPSINSKFSPKHHPEVPQPKNNEVEKTATMVPETKEKNIPVQKTEVNLDASFRRNPSFENMIGATRHAGLFKMVSPLIDSHFNVNSEIVFKWTLNEPAKIEFKIMNNTGAIVQESEFFNQNNYSLPPGILKKGLYYFQVLQKDDIIFFGKFEVE
jgi:hypothetical protein